MKLLLQLLNKAVLQQRLRRWEFLNLLSASRYLSWNDIWVYSYCIEQLGDNADHPSTDDLNDVLPSIIERHGVACTRIMLASTVAGEAPAAAIIRDILKHDEVLALPAAEERSIIPARRDASGDDAEREELKAKRREAKARKQAEAKARREQAARAQRR